MREYILIICLLFIAGCESQGFVFQPCSTYGDSYLTAMSQYVCMLYNWDYEAQGKPPAPQSPAEMYAGKFPLPSGGSRTFTGGFMQGYAGGMQAGAIQLQAARNHAYNIALSRYYSLISAQ